MLTSRAGGASDNDRVGVPEIIPVLVSPLDVAGGDNALAGLGREHNT